MKNQNSNKKRGFGKTLLIVIAVILSIAALGSVAAIGLSSFRERNPDNLIKVDDNYIHDTKTLYGLEIKVDENGAIKFKGQTSKSEQFIVQTVTLPAGTYTLSGIEDVDVSKMALRATWGSGQVAYAGTSNATFTLDGETSVVIDITVTGASEDRTITWKNKTILPCLVAGDTAGEFYA